MSSSQGKKKNQPGWLILAIVVLILIGINDRYEVLSLNKGNGISQAISGIGTAQNSAVNKTILSAVPEELRSNYFLQQKERGCCKDLSGDVAVAVIMVNDSVSQWDSEAVEELKSALEKNSQDVMEDAEAFQIDLSLNLHYYTAQVTGDVGGDGSNDWQDEAVKSVGLPSIAQAHNYLTKAHSAKEAPLMFVLNKAGRASASISNVEWFTMFHKAGYDGFQHELLHIFGAKDFYYPKEVEQWATKHFPQSIMNSSDEEVDSLTAYLVGWTDTVADNAIAFLKDSNAVTESYMQEQNAMELFTGNGTKEFSDGTYTGDLVRGYRHGTGTMQYDDGGWYTGQWDNGQKVGVGVGKIVFSNGSVYEGEFLDGQYHGTGKLTYSTNSVYEGGFKNGELHGQGTYTNADGASYTGGWDSGEKSGKGSGKEFYDNGYYEGEFYDGKRHGQGTYVWSSGSQYTGQWVNGERTGYGTYTWPDGKTKSGNWKDGKIVE